jgi:hypothetical protein
LSNLLHKPNTRTTAAGTKTANGSGDRITVSNLTEMMTKEGKVAMTRAHIGQANFVKNFSLPGAKKFDTTALDIMRDMYKEAKVIARENKMKEVFEGMKMPSGAGKKRPQTQKVSTMHNRPNGPRSAGFNLNNDGNLTSEKSLW